MCWIKVWPHCVLCTELEKNVSIQTQSTLLHKQCVAAYLPSRLTLEDSSPHVRKYSTSRTLSGVDYFTRDYLQGTFPLHSVCGGQSHMTLPQGNQRKK